MTQFDQAGRPPVRPDRAARRRFLAALGLFFVWVAFLLVLGTISATGPGRINVPIDATSPVP